MRNPFHLKFPGNALPSPMILSFSNDAGFTEEEFFLFCQNNPDLKLEKNKKGEIIIMSPTGSETGRRNGKIIIKLGIWNEESLYGEVFDSSTGFTLPDNSVLSPDASVIASAQWNQIDITKRKKFAPICPEFIVELKSENDSLKNLQEKMQNWLDNGVQLGWLIDPDDEKVYIYRPKQAIEMISGFDNSLSGEEVLKGFILDLKVLR